MAIARRAQVTTQSCSLRATPSRSALGNRWDYQKLLRTAARFTRSRLRARLVTLDEARVEDLACEAVARCIEKYDPGKDKNWKGPILLVRWKVAEVLKEAAESQEKVAMDTAKLEGLMA